MGNKFNEHMKKTHNPTEPRTAREQDVQTSAGQEQNEVAIPDLELIELEPLNIRSKLPRYRGKRRSKDPRKILNREKQAPEAEKQASETENGINMKPAKNGTIPPPEYRYKPGQSGNPKGRPPSNETLLKAILKDAVSEMGDEPIPKNLYPRAKEMLGYAQKDKVPSRIVKMSQKEFVVRLLIWNTLTAEDPRYYAELRRLMDLPLW